MPSSSGCHRNANALQCWCVQGRPGQRLVRRPCRVHGVTLDEVREAILEHPYWAVPGRDGTILMYGRTFAGRYLLVVTIAEGEAAFVVTARDMTTAEKKTFRRKAR